MSETQETQEKNAPKTPQEYLATVPGAPGPELIDEWKRQSPNGNLKLFVSPDGRRVYILRGLNGLEFKAASDSVPQNSSNPENDLHIAAVVKATVWTNASQGNKLSEMGLRSGPAGLPLSLFNLVTELSEFFDPARLRDLSGDL